MDNFVLRSFSMSLTSVMHNYIEYTLYAEPDTGVSLEQATAQIKEVLKDLARNGIPAETLNRVKKRMLQTDTRNKSNVGSNYLRMSEQLTSGLQPTDTKQHLSLIQQVSLDDINQLLQSIAQPVRRSTALISPPE
jgi:predicted Zn-dependent peptidase